MTTKKPSGAAPRKRPRKTGGAGSGRPGRPVSGETQVAPRELIIVAKPDAGLRASPEGVASITGKDVSAFADMVSAKDIVIEPLFGISEERIEARAAMMTAASPEETHMSQFYSVRAPDEKLDELADKFLKNPLVESSYVKPGVELAAAVEEDVREAMSHEADIDVDKGINDMQPSAQEAPVTTPNFTNRQLYLNPAPVGVDAPYAWQFPGGRGASVNVIDLEWGWQFTHEDLLVNQGGVLAGNNSPSNNHGTAVLGEISGDVNNYGITGISPDARVSAVSFTTLPTARAIRIAADRLQRGDIMLLEVHRAGPRHNFQARSDQLGYIAVEWWPDDYAAIRYAVSRGVLVVEAAGNGAENFDDPLYDVRPPGFPTTWRNPFNPANLSSFAVVVGAGAPPPGTHGRNHGPDRSRLGFSNYGRRVDCQGWGREVTTTGYGDLQGGTDRNQWYTDMFSGTSSASPIIVGALACTQGFLRARGLPLLTPASAIQLLRTTGSPQMDAPTRPRTQRIGNRPNLRQMFGRFIGGRVRTLPLYRYWNPQIGDHFYTTNWRELGRGRNGWRYEGVQCHIFPRRIVNTVPLYRYWNPQIGDHFYTTNWRELGRGRYGWRYEGIQGYVYARRPAGSMPLYRYWNPKIGDHFYTTNWRELGRGRYGYRYEGVQCFVFPRPVSRPQAAPGEAGAEETEMPMAEGEMFAPEFGAGMAEYEAEYGPAPEELDIPSVEPSITEMLGQEFETAGEFGFEAGEYPLSGSFEMEDVADPSQAFLTGFDVEADDFAAETFETGEEFGFEEMSSFTMEEFESEAGTVNINLNIGTKK